MRILDFLKGDFIDVIHSLEDVSGRVVWRFDRQGHAIRYGAKLTVRQGQVAVFVHEGQLADVFDPGLYMLETNNMPVLTRLQHWDHGFKSPFKSEIYFLDTTRITGLKWGTKTPVLIRDPDFGAARLRAFGTYSIRIIDPALFMTEIVGTDGNLTTDEISFQIRSLIMQEFSRVVASSGLPVLDMAANKTDLSRLVRDEITPVLGSYGLSIPDLVIESISLPGDAQARLDRELAAGRNRPLSPRPPAAPKQQLWYTAEDGETQGPFTASRLGQMASRGEVSRNTYVWTEGQDGWQIASDVEELAHLFAARPPPPPRN